MFLISSPTSSQNFTTALQLAQGLRHQDHQVALVLLQDAVLAAVRGHREAENLLKQTLRDGVRFFVLEEDLRLRGFHPPQLLPFIHSISYPGLVALMEDSHWTRGVF
ncbi:MAG: sulfurtransferase complex subunit TusB [Chloroflexi bacterium]|nr:sulfurtransferase complex subunit TusB [Chloroflexota bacterium]